MGNGVIDMDGDASVVSVTEVEEAAGVTSGTDMA